MVDTNELKSLIVLNSIPSIGPVRIRRLIEHFGSATNVLSASIDELSQIESIGMSIAKNILMFKNKIDPEKELALVKKENVKILTYRDEEYPESLNHLPDPPILLYIKGEMKKSDIFSISIVGTRKPTSYGRLVVEHFIKQLSEYKLTIISGLAYGIDTISHECAIKYGLRTIAVLGNGLGIYYPLSNKKLQDKIPNHGAVISEFPYFYKPNKSSFPQRNRIVAALSLGTVVVEADITSGAMITSKFALDLGKDVFAVPGSIFSKQSRGTNLLIKSGAKMTTCAEDIIEEIRGISELIKEYSKNKKEVKNEFRHYNLSDMTDDMKKVLNVIAAEPEGIHIDKLQSITNFEITKLMNIIFQLELNAKVKELPGKIYIYVS